MASETPQPAGDEQTPARKPPPSRLSWLGGGIILVAFALPFHAVVPTRGNPKGPRRLLYGWQMLAGRIGLGDSDPLVRHCTIAIAAATVLILVLGVRLRGRALAAARLVLALAGLAHLAAMVYALPEGFFPALRENLQPILYAGDVPGAVWILLVAALAALCVLPRPAGRPGRVSPLRIARAAAGLALLAAGLWVLASLWAWEAMDQPEPGEERSYRLLQFAYTSSILPAAWLVVTAAAALTADVTGNARLGRFARGAAVGSFFLIPATRWLATVLTGLGFSVTESKDLWFDVNTFSHAAVPYLLGWMLGLIACEAARRGVLHLRAPR